MHESLDTTHIELLVALRHTGSLVRAAEQLSISPSAASHRLREAQRRIGVELTVAEGRSLRLTDAGVHVAEVAEQVRTSLRSAEETARWMSSAARSTVRLALDFYDTAPWFERLLSGDPTFAEVDAVRVPYDASLDAVLRHRVDLALIVVPIDEAEGDVLCGDELVAVVRHDHPAAERGVLVPSDVAAAVYATVGDRPRHGFEHHAFFEPAGVRPERLRKVESLAMILRSIRNHGAVTVQPRLAVRDAWLDGLALVPLEATTIRVRWEFLSRPDAGDGELALRDAICDLVVEGSAGSAPRS